MKPLGEGPEPYCPVCHLQIPACECIGPEYARSLVRSDVLDELEDEEAEDD